MSSEYYTLECIIVCDWLWSIYLLEVGLNFFGYIGRKETMSVIMPSREEGGGPQPL